MKRRKPAPRGGKHAERNDLILAMIEEGMSRAAVGEKFGMSASQVGHVVMTPSHVLHLLRVRKLKPATVAKRYRMEVSTAERIAQGKARGTVGRKRGLVD